ncbi:MAG TPA: VOC family protein [Candidatus Saccharimonadales bacterium]|nr:VOC family protein [Candidatus Saccharimonadales bacterium]
MLGDSQVGAVLPVKDLEAAKKFYSETLGLKPGDEDPGGILFSAGGGTKVFVYPTQFAGTNQATAAGFVVDDVAGVAEALSAKDVKLEHYDLPGATMDGDVHVMGEMKAIWFKDPDGNIISVSNMAG